jgi:hypothetical protein
MLKKLSYTKLIREKYKRWKELCQQWQMRHVPSWGFTEEHQAEKDEIEQAVSLKHSTLVSRCEVADSDISSAKEVVAALKEQLYDAEQNLFRLEREQRKNWEQRHSLWKKFGGDVCRGKTEEDGD